MDTQTQLDDTSRTKLDGIVQQMTANNEPDANIQAVVNDFKQKYGGQTSSQNGTVSPYFPASPTDNPLQAGGKSLGNVIPSTVNLAQGLTTAVAHPVDTLTGIGNAIRGFGENIGREL